MTDRGVFSEEDPGTTSNQNFPAIDKALSLLRARLGVGLEKSKLIDTDYSGDHDYKVEKVGSVSYPYNNSNGLGTDHSGGHDYKVKKLEAVSYSYNNRNGLEQQSSDYIWNIVDENGVYRLSARMIAQLARERATVNVALTGGQHGRCKNTWGTETKPHCPLRRRRRCPLSEEKLAEASICIAVVSRQSLLRMAVKRWSMYNQYRLALKQKLMKRSDQPRIIGFSSIVPSDQRRHCVERFGKVKLALLFDSWRLKRFIFRKWLLWTVLP